MKKVNIDIKKIIRERNFNTEYNLLGQLDHLPTSLALYLHLQEAYPRTAEKRKEIQKLLQATSKSVKKLGQLIQKTSTQTKVHISQIPDVLRQHGYNNIISNSEGWNIESLQQQLVTSNKIFEYALSQVPIDSGGQKTNSVPQFVIYKLVSIYYDGTNQVAKCGWYEDKDSHVGDFYKFVMDIKPYLEQLGIELGTEKTIGEYCRRAIKTFKLKCFEKLWVIIQVNFDWLISSKITLPPISRYLTLGLILQNLSTFSLMLLLSSGEI